MKNLDTLTSAVKSAPTPEARAGVFVQSYSDLILENADNPGQLRQIVQQVVSQKGDFAKTIAHTA